MFGKDDKKFTAELARDRWWGLTAKRSVSQRTILDELERLSWVIAAFESCIEPYYYY